MIDKKKLVLLHVSFWVIHFVYESIFWGSPLDLSQVLMIIPFYINYFWLVPALFLKNKPVYYVIWFILIVSMIVLSYVAYYVIVDGLQAIRPSIPTIMGIGTYVSFYYISISTGSRLMVYWMENKRLHHELMMRKTNTQIQMMKSNVNIPFILQTLGSIEGKANIAPENAQQPVISLSNVLRYGLYDSQVAEVFLYREIDILNDYFLLVNQNYTKFSLQLTISGSQENIVVPPNLIVKFVGLWKDYYENELLGVQEILLTILPDEVLVTVTVPGKATLSLVSMVKERFTEPKQAGFDIDCKEEKEALQLVIKAV